MALHAQRKHPRTDRSLSDTELLDAISDELECELPEAERLAVAVIATLEERLPLGEIESLEAELPGSLRERVAEVDRILDLPHLDEQAFCHRVARRLRMTDDDAERTVAGVFRVLRSSMSSREARRVERNLPEDLERLWNFPGPFARR